MVEERQGFLPLIKRMLIRAAEGCLRANARKAYSLALTNSSCYDPGSRLRIGDRHLMQQGRSGRGQMSAIEAIVITAIGTAAAVVWALCLEAWSKKSRPRG